MLEIRKGNPWIFWPSSICDTFPKNPANKLLSGDSFFRLTMTLELLDRSKDQKTLFTIVPKFTGLDIHPDKIVWTVTCEDKTEYFDIPSFIQPETEIKVEVLHRPKEYLALFINDIKVHRLDLTDRTFGIDPSPHLILGAGNFPKNGFNLNYTDFNLHSFKIEDTEGVVADHDFEEFIHDKAVDKTGNCNFIHKL